MKTRQTISQMSARPVLTYADTHAEADLDDQDLFAESRRRRRDEQDSECHRRVLQLLEDRERISRDLHDGVLQSLYVVGLGLAACQLHMDETHQKAGEQLAQSVKHLEHAIEEIRTFLKTDLGARLIEAEDLDTSLRSLTHGMTASASLSCHVDIDPGAAARVPTTQRGHVLHIAREALSNCLRHAQASHAGVSLKTTHGSLRLEVWDDGIGFDPHKPPRRGFGLHNLMARGDQLCARLCIRSKPSQGTQVILDLPQR